MEIVIPVRKGGLGNQMFQVTAALIVAKETGKEVILPREQPHIHNPLQLQYEQSVFKSISNQLAIYIDDLSLQTLKQNGFWCYPGEPGFESWSPSVPKGPVILHGYFQHYPTIQHHESYIREFFRTNLDCKEGDSTKVGVHIRRGDYLKFSDIHPVQNISYYEQAMKKFPSGKQFVIFSDDIAWCKEQTLFQQANCSICETTNEIECLKEMISCEGGFVCGNSTYSWWAAFLGSYRKRNPVIVPKKWFKDETPALFPPEWILL